MNGRRPVATGLAGWARGRALAIVSAVFGTVLFRLCLGRWPDAAESRLFRSGLVNQAIGLPPCLRAMLPVPDAKLCINSFLLLDGVRTGVLRIDNVLERHHAGNDALSVPPLSGNPLAFWRGPPVAFLHLEKTGGGAIAQALTGSCHPEQIDPDPSRTAAPHAMRPFAGRDAAAIRRRALIFGHYDLPSLRQLDPGRPVITVLRNPSRRIVSLYHYWRSVNRDVLDKTVGNEAVELAHECDLLAFLETDNPSVRNYIDNFYVRRLTGVYVTSSGTDKLAANPGACLERALTGLQGVEFVGVMEQMTRTLARLGQQFDVDCGQGSARHNAGADNADVAPRNFHHVSRVPLTPDQETSLARLTTLDKAIYAAACERFSAEGQ